MPHEYQPQRRRRRTWRNQVARLLPIFLTLALVSAGTLLTVGLIRAVERGHPPWSLTSRDAAATNPPQRDRLMFAAHDSRAALDAVFFSIRARNEGHDFEPERLGLEAENLLATAAQLLRELDIDPIEVLNRDGVGSELAADSVLASGDQTIKLRSIAPDTR